MLNLKKIELTKEKQIFVIWVPSALVVLGLFFVFYMPLMKDLRVKYSQCRVIEKKVLESRKILGSSGVAADGRELLSEEAVPAAINELAEQGMKNGISFVSISPKEINAKNPQYKVLPIEMVIESSYGKLGAFLGTLGDLKKALARVKSFDITSSRDDPKKRMANLVVELYFAGNKA